MDTKKTVTKSKTKGVKAVKATKSSVTAKLKKTVNTSSSTPKFSLRQLNIVSGLSFLVLAVLAVVLMGSSVYELTISYLTVDKLAGGAIVPAYRFLIDVEYRWLLAATLVLSALGPVLRATRNEISYDKSVKSKVMPWRWLEQGALQALLGVVVVTLVGFQDVTTIKLFALGLVLVSLLSWYAEKELLVNKAAALRSHLFATITGLVLILFMTLPLLFTYMYGQVRAPWYVYSVAAAFVLTLGLNRFNQYNYLRGHKSWKSYDIMERNHLVIGLVSKLSIAVILIVGLAK